MQITQTNDPRLPGLCHASPTTLSRGRGRLARSLPTSPGCAGAASLMDCRHSVGEWRRSKGRGKVSSGPS
eukprot:scaffold302799_cov41-Tisochrysis_lutea.AAC.1